MLLTKDTLTRVHECPAWMAKNRKSAVVKASQPEFLSIVAIGCLMVASAILPLSIEGSYRFERDAITLKETDILNEDIHHVVNNGTVQNC